MARRGPGRPDDRPGRGRRDARGRRTARARPSDARALRVWAGVRPLFEDRRTTSPPPRYQPRPHAVRPHRSETGWSGFFTITSGKLTTFRLMAQDTVDAMCAQLGDTRPCRTRDAPLPGSERGEYYAGHRLARARRTARPADLRVRDDPAPAARARDARRARSTSTTSAARCDWAWARVRAGSAPTAPRASCTRWAIDGATADHRAAGFPAGALEGDLADPLWRWQRGCRFDEQADNSVRLHFRAFRSGRFRSRRGCGSLGCAPAPAIAVGVYRLERSPSWGAMNL